MDKYRRVILGDGNVIIIVAIYFYPQISYTFFFYSFRHFEGKRPLFVLGSRALDALIEIRLRRVQS